MIQFHNAPTNFANLASGEIGIGYQSLQPVSNNGKRNLFSLNWSDNDAKKNRLQDFYDIFLFARVGDKMTKNWYNPLQKSNFRTRQVRYTSRRQVLD